MIHLYPSDGAKELVDAISSLLDAAGIKENLGKRAAGSLENERAKTLSA